MPNSRAAQAGFTLIEIIVALAIVAVAVLAISSALSEHTKATSGLEQRLLASWVASNEMARVRHAAKSEKVKTGRQSDTVEMGNHRWRATTQIQETEVERVFLLTVSVRGEADREGQVMAEITSAVSDAF